MWQNDPVVGNPLPTTTTINHPGAALAPIRPNSDNLTPQEDIPLPPPPAPPLPGGNARPQVQPTAAWEQDPVVPQEPNQEWQNDPIEPARNFRNIYEDQELGGVAQEFYRQRDGLHLSQREAVSKFIEDRTWRQANTVSGIRDLVGGRNMEPEQQQRLGYLRQYWESLPNVYQEGGRGIPGVAVNLAAGVIDPTIIAGPLAARALSAVTGRALGVPAQVGITAVTDAAVSSGSNIASQATDVATGNRESISLPEAGLAGVAGAGASVLGNVVAAGAGRYMRQSTGSPVLDAQRDAKIGEPPEGTVSFRERAEAAIERGAAEMFDQYAPFERIQRGARDIGTSPRELRDAYRGLTPDDLDPVSGAHYQARLLAGSSGRVDDFLQRGGVLPPNSLNPTIRENTFEYNVSPSVLSIYEPLNRGGQTDNFNMYLMALRARYIRDVVNPNVMQTARDEVLAGRARRPQESQQAYAQVVASGGGRRNVESPQEFQARADAAARAARKATIFDDSQMFLDSGLAKTPQEALAFANKAIDDWINFGNARQDFIEGRQQYSKVMNTILEYERRSGVLSANDIVNITGGRYDNPRNVEFFYAPFLPANSGTRAIKGGKVILASSPGRARLKGGTQNRMDVEEATVSHIFRAINASDRNRVKVALYRDLQTAISRGEIEADAVASKIPVDTKALLREFYSDPNAEDMLRRAGIFSDVQSTPPEDILRVMALNSWTGKGKDNIDIVFRDGKVESWRIHDPEILAALKPYQIDGTVGTFLNFSNALARYRSAVIMANPVTMIRNAVRDTMAASISSPFDFLPVASTVKGGFGVFREPILRMLQYASDKIPGNPGAALLRKELAAGDAYRRAWASGMGYSGQLKNSIARGRLELSAHHAKVSPAEKFYQDSLRYLQGNVVSRKLAGWLEFSNSVEMASRMGEFYLAKAFGMSDVAAAYLGREVATDFGQRGRNQFLRMLMNGTSFLNAGMQSVAKLARLARTHPGKLLAGMAAYAIYDAATHAINSGHPSYQDQPEAVRAQNVLIPMYRDAEEAWRWVTGQQSEFQWQSDVEQGNPQVRNAPEVVRYIPVPKPFEFGMLGTLINGMMDTISTRNGNHIRDAFVTSLTTAIPNFHAPDVVQPFWDLWRNKDGLGRTIAPNALGDSPGLSQYTERTPEWARSASQSLAAVVGMFQAEGTEPRTLLTPIEVEYLANFVMPGLLNVPLQVLTEATHNVAKTGERAAARPDEADVARNPMSLVTRGLQLGATSRSSPALQQLYEIKSRADALSNIERADVTDLFRVLDYDPNNMSQERQQALPMSQTLRATLDGIRVLTVEAQAISTSTELNPEEKRRRLDANLQTRNDIARNTLILLRQSNVGDRLLAGFFNDPRNDLPQQNIIRQTIENFRRD